MDKSVEKTVTLFRKSYAGRLTADGAFVGG